MNHVWTAIAFRAPCVAQRAPRQPLLHLFNGHAQNTCIRTIPARIARQTEWRRALSASASLPKGGGGRSKAKRITPKEPRLRKAGKESAPTSTTPSKLEPAPTVATHTEGVTEEEEPLSWRDYDPVGGMPLPDGERSQAQINGIFGSEDLDADTGNYILSVMYWRRLSGALIDSGADFPVDSGVSREQAMRGLSYLRSLDPDFNEQAAGQTWVEEESLRMQEEIEDRAVKLRLYKRDAEPEPAPEVIEESDQGTEYGRERNQGSALLQLRERNKAILAAQEAQREVDRERAETAALARHRGPLQLAGGVQPPTQMALTPSGGITISRPQTKAWLQPVERKPWVQYYEKQAEIIKENVTPNMSLLKRLGPPFAMLLGVLALCAFLSDNYTPPPKSARIWPDTPPAVTTLGALTAALFVSFILGRMPPFWRAYNKFMTIVPAYPYAVSLLGATFRHDRFAHLVINTTSLWLFGSMLHENVGRGTFLAIFFASGAIGGYSSLAYNVFRKNWSAYIFGSSGAGLGVLAATCVLQPNGTLKFWGKEIPMSAWVFLGIYGIGELVAVVRRRGGNIDHVGHLGGIVAGAAAAGWLRLMWAKERAEREGRTGGDSEMKKTDPATVLAEGANVS